MRWNIHSSEIWFRGTWRWTDGFGTESFKDSRLSSPSSRSISAWTTSPHHVLYFIIGKYQLPTHKHQFIGFCSELSHWRNCTYSNLEIFKTPQRYWIDAWERSCEAAFPPPCQVCGDAQACVHATSNKHTAAVSRRPWMFDSNSPTAREESTTTPRWALVLRVSRLSGAPTAVTQSFSPITLDENPNHNEAHSRKQ